MKPAFLFVVLAVAGTVYPARADHKHYNRCDHYVSRPAISVRVQTGPRYESYGYRAPYYHYPYYAPATVYPRYYGPTVYRTVRVYRGEQVEDALNVRVQLALARKGYYNGPIDGEIGSNSRAAIRAYQTDMGLPVNGRTDGYLIRSLNLN